MRPFASALLTLGFLLPTPPVAAQALSLQEIILRTKPATVLVVSEITSEVTVDCGNGPQKVTPGPFRETGTGWFVDSNGWIVTNGHVVQPAHELPGWVENEQARADAAVRKIVREENARSYASRTVTSALGQLEAGMRRIQGLGQPDALGRISPRCMDAHALPLENDSLDAIFCAFGIRNLSDLRVAGREQLRCLRPGGQLVVLEFFRPSRAATRASARWR